jgi:hypothetical protein
MGLDMFAWKVEPEQVINDFEVAKDESNQSYLHELYYWRKHHDLHGWMEALYRVKGGTKESFNCVKVRLTLDDLNLLEHAVLNGKLPQTQGFFFGTNTPDEESMKNDMEFIAKAKIAIVQGFAVYYDSWW